MKNRASILTHILPARILPSIALLLGLGACGLSPTTPTINKTSEIGSGAATAESSNASGSTTESSIPATQPATSESSQTTAPEGSQTTASDASSTPSVPVDSDPVDAYLTSGASIYGKAPSTVFAVGTEVAAYKRTDANGANRDLPTKIYYPAKTAGEGAAIADGKFPFILFSHGSNGDYDTYPGPIGLLVQAGFIVAAPNYPYNKKGVTQVLDDALKGNQSVDASEIITIVTARNMTKGDKFYDHIDTSKGIGAAGHSLGGFTTHGMLAMKRDTRITSAIIYAGGTLGSVTGPSVKVMVQHGDDDETVELAKGRKIYDGLPESWPKAFVTHIKGGHWVYLWPQGVSYPQTTSSTVDWFRWSLYNDPQAMEKLSNDAYAEGKTKWESVNLVNIQVEAESFVYKSGVQTEVCSEGGTDVSSIDTGDWLSWNVELPNAGEYTVQYRVASLNGGGTIRFENAGGAKAYGNVAVPNTGNWQTWTTVSHKVTLPAGKQRIRVKAVVGGFNLNWLKILQK